MGTNDKTPAGAAPAASLKSRLEQLQRELEAQRKRVNRSTAFTVILSVLLLALLAGYFVYGYIELQTLTEPDKMLAFAEEQADQRLPDARRAIEQQIDEQAPEWAAEMSKQAQSALPQARTQLVDLAMEGYERGVDQMSGVSEEQFKTMLDKHRPMIKRLLEDLKNRPDLTDASLIELEDALREQFGTDMQAGAHDLLLVLKGINRQVEKLKKTKEDDLTQEEKVQKGTLMLIRALHKEQTGDPLPPEKIAANRKKLKLPALTKKPAKGTGAPSDQPKDKAPKDKPVNPETKENKGRSAPPPPPPPSEKDKPAAKDKASETKPPAKDKPPADK